MEAGDSVRVSLDHWSRDFDPGLSPSVRVPSGARLVVDTYCCAKGAVTRDVSTAPEDFYSTLDYTPGMPITGPIEIAGARFGDVLQVDILDIQVAEQGWTMALSGRGAVGHRIETGESRVVPIEDGQAVLFDRVRVPIRPMIGSIGTTPPEGPWRAGIPGPHGGNMDCKILGAGTSVFLPVLIPGGHLALGDLHAIQGDGETGCAGVEIAGEVSLQVHLLRGLDVPLPIIETADLLVTVHTAEDLKQAAIGATERMADLVASWSVLSFADAAMLLSQVGDLRICQIVNPTMTCRMEVPKGILAQLGINTQALWQQYRVDSNG
jgi:amidase